MESFEILSSSSIKVAFDLSKTTFKEIPPVEKNENRQAASCTNCNGKHTHYPCDKCHLTTCSKHRVIVPISCSHQKQYIQLCATCHEFSLCALCFCEKYNIETPCECKKNQDGTSSSQFCTSCSGKSLCMTVEIIDDFE